MEGGYRVDLGWLGSMDDAKMTLGSRGRTVEAGDNLRKIGKSGELWCMCR